MHHISLLLLTIAIILCSKLSASFISSVNYKSVIYGKSNRIFSSVANSKLFMSTPEPLWREEVEYVDLAATNANSDINDGNKSIRSLPLFLLGNPFYPEGTTYLNVFEMKYRTMMFDIAQSDDCFGYIMSDQGNIASVGTICKVVERELLEDGRQLLAVKGMGRFRVKKILKTLPYILAEVETEITDDEAVDEKDQAAITSLELETYCMLKYYMRLMRSFDANKEMVVSRAVKKNRPSFATASSTAAVSIGGDDTALKIPVSSTKKDADGFISTGMTDSQPDSIRRTAFSFAVASMIQMTQAREAQLVLQTRSISKRLTAQRDILSQASDLIAEQLIKIGSLTPERREEIRSTCFVKDPPLIKSAEEAESGVDSSGGKLTPVILDDDTDILPAEIEEDKTDEEKDEWDISNIE